MKALIIEDDDEARAIAEKLGFAEDMMTSARVRLAKCIKGGVGVIIGRKHGEIRPDGTMEFVFVTLFANFGHGENGWAVHGFTDVARDDLPFVVEKLNEIEKEILPAAANSKSALERLTQKGIDETLLG